MSLLNIFKGWDGELTVKLSHWMYLDNAGAKTRETR